jgi:hypothetical protein
VSGFLLGATNGDVLRGKELGKKKKAGGEPALNQVSGVEVGIEIDLTNLGVVVHVRDYAVGHPPSFGIAY